MDAAFISVSCNPCTRGDSYAIVEVGQAFLEYSHTRLCLMTMNYDTDRTRNEKTLLVDAGE